MEVVSRYRWRLSFATAFILLALTLSLVFTISSRVLTHAAGADLIQISHDPYQNSTSQHHTQVEPDTFSFGHTIVATFQSGRFFNGGASNIGWATSTNAGETWTHGFLPNITVFAGGPYDRASDPSVAYDARHKVWMISYLAIRTANIPPFGIIPVHTDLLVSRSTDGGLTWNNPVIVRLGGPPSFLDKNWTACDATASSPFYGHCYSEFDNAARGNIILMSTSTDGGKTWGPQLPTANQLAGIGGQPVVQPNGTVVVPIVQFLFKPFRASMAAFTSTNGGASWNSSVKIASIFTFFEAAFVRNPDLPSAEVDASGKVYVVWYDCRFEPGCSANDIVMSTSTDGVTWSTVARVPIDPIGSGIDHFTPGIGVDRSTSGSSAHIGLAYYYFTNANCTTDTCDLDVGFISSTNGGTSWSTARRLAGPMKLSWLALTTQGFMYGDYISTSIVPGSDDATPVFAVAKPPTLPAGATTCLDPGAVCDESMFTTAQDLVAITGGTNTSTGDKVVVTSSPSMKVLSKLI